MDSGYASIEGRSTGDDGPPSGPEKHASFSSVGHTTTVGGSFDGTPAEEFPWPRSPRAWPRRTPRRDYSVDEKTDALFHEFLRHDPHFDDAPPSTARHRAREDPAGPPAPTIPAIEEEPGGGCPGSGLCARPSGALLDKLATGLEDRLLLPHLTQPIAAAPTLATATAAPTSPDHSPA
ncbi:Protein Dos [Myotis brandtii]|uniref:Protein Dos n=1 Tax=Myotis brandtii TaxID=109478 RepID=S7MUP0_MYOBR|nr:Protein Dos [Myotis brandtii]